MVSGSGPNDDDRVEAAANSGSAISCLDMAVPEAAICFQVVPLDFIATDRCKLRCLDYFPYRGERKLTCVAWMPPMPLPLMRERPQLMPSAAMPATRPLLRPRMMCLPPEASRPL